MRVAFLLSLSLIVCALYAGSLDVPFVFDDRMSIVANQSIRSLAVPDCFVDDRPGSPTAGRPLVNASFALNYAFAKLAPWAYHATNLALHLGCTVLAFLTLELLFTAPRSPAVLKQHAAVGALLTSALFALHPIAVEIVLYTSQRTEALLAVFFLLACYAFLRHVRHGERGMLVLLAASTILAALSKATMALLVPLLLLLDRAFVSGSFRDAAVQHWRALACAAVGYVPLALLEAGSPRGVSVSFGNLDYTLQQGRIVLGYLADVFWPNLTLDYGELYLATGAASIPHVVVLGAVVLLSLVLTFVMPRTGFTGAWVFGLLAPTSSVVAILSEVGADRRMYLPMIGLLAAVVAAAIALVDTVARRAVSVARAARGAAVATAAVVLAFFSLQTVLRTDAFESPIVFWRTALLEVPKNPRAAYLLAAAYRDAGQLDLAVAAYERAVGLYDRFPQAHGELGAVLLLRGEAERALPHMQRSARLQPTAHAHFQYGIALASVGKLEAAREQLQHAIALDPAFTPALERLHALAKPNAPAP